MKFRNCRKIAETDLNRIPKELPNLCELDLSENVNVNDSFFHFFFRDPLRNLEILDLSRTQISDIGLGTFCATSEKIELKILKLNQCPQISDRCFEFLNRIKKSLIRVEISETFCTFEGAKRNFFDSLIFFGENFQIPSGP